MAPIDTTIPAQPKAPVTRARTSVRRREPTPLDQLPAWRDLVPVMDPALTTEPRSDGLAALLGGLDPDQRRAVTHETGPLLVVAGAGTGKTQVITRRIAWLIATRRARPSEILALTFTDKAADEMAIRVDQLVPYGYTDTNIATFHAFGDAIIREHALELGLPPDVRVLSRAEVVIFLREHLYAFELDDYRPLGDPTRFLSALATLFSRCKDEDITPATYLAYAERVATEAEAVAAAAGSVDPGEAMDMLDDGEAGRETARRQGELARAYARYQELLTENGFIDFGDQVALALRLVRESAAARTAVAGRFRYVLVDEFQDTNRAQAELVALLAEPHRNVTVVGDDDQAIYAFRGAAIDNILDFQDRYRGARTVVLRRNYRSLRPILDASYRLVRHNDPDRLEVRTGLSKRLRAMRSTPSASPVRLEAFATGAEESDWIAAEIARRIAAGAAPRDHAVLVRANGHADPILRALNLAGVPWRFSGASGLYARPEVRLLMAFLRTIADPTSSVDLYALAASEAYGLGGDDLTAIVNTARRRHRSVAEILDELDRQPGVLRVSSATREAVHRLVVDLERFGALAHERSAGRGPVRLPARPWRARAARGGRHARGRGGARQHRALLRHRAGPVGAARRRSRRLRRPASPDADRGRRRSRHGRARPRRRCGRRPDGPQGQGPRVRGRVPARDGGRPLPGQRSVRGAGAAGRPGPRRADDAGACPRRGTAAVLRGDDPRARRARPVPRGGLRRRAGPAGVAVRPRSARPAERDGEPGGGAVATHPTERMEAFADVAGRAGTGAAARSPSRSRSASTRWTTT